MSGCPIEGRARERFSLRIYLDLITGLVNCASPTWASLIHPSIHSFIHPPSIHSSIHSSSIHSSSIHSFIHSFIHPPFIHKFIHSSVYSSFIHSLILHPFIHPFIQLLFHKLIHSFIHPCIHPPIRPSFKSLVLHRARVTADCTIETSEIPVVRSGPCSQPEERIELKSIL